MDRTEINKIRDKLGMSYSELARYLGVSRRLVTYWETDERTIRGPALVLLMVMSRLGRNKVDKIWASLPTESS
jgi:DNA-binding transcriptional regulator YiaG